MGCSKKQKNSDVNNAFWNISIEQQYKLLNTSHQGLKYQDVEQHIKNYGFNRLNHKNEAGNIRLFFAQFKNSIILLFATGLSFFLNDRLDAAIILTIVLISGCLGFWQEKGAASAIKELLAISFVQCIKKVLTLMKMETFNKHLRMILVLHLLEKFYEKPIWMNFLNFGMYSKATCQSSGPAPKDAITST